MQERETVFDILMERCERDKERACIYLIQSGQPDIAISYGQLLRNAAAYAQRYEAAGIQPGEVVILVLAHGMDLIGAFWGAVLQGIIPSIMPFLTEKLLPERYRRDLAALFQLTRPAGVVTYPDFESEMRAVLQEGDFSCALLLSEQIPIEVDANICHMAGTRCVQDDIVFLQHSSGTTGLQKGVAITHRALLNQLNCYAQAIHLSKEDVIVSWLPLYHDMGLIAGFLLPILCGVPLALMSPFDWVRSPVKLLQAVTRYRGTLSWLPNFAYNFCASKIRDGQLEGINLSTWRAVINCSEPMFLDSFHQFSERFSPYGLRPAALATSYAMAENVFGVTQGGIEAPVAVDVIDVASLQEKWLAAPAASDYPSVNMLSCGKPIPGTRIKIVDGQKNALPERHVGEVAVQSNCMLLGYYNRPAETVASIVDGWYLTGDYGYVAGEELYITGRKKDLIIVGGRNIFPQDIEAVANEVPGIRPGRAVAFGVFNEALGTEEVALVAEPALPDEAIGDNEACWAIEDAVRLAVNRNTAISLRYVRLVKANWLIKTSSGKIARSANRERFCKELMES